MEAIILAAGDGSRFGRKNNIPKPLVKLDNNTLLGHTLFLLSEINVSRVVVVGGYKYSLIKNYLEKNKKRWGLDVEVTANQNYKLGNIETLKKGLGFVSKSTIVTNADHVFSQKVIPILRQGLSGNKLVIACDFKEKSLESGDTGFLSVNGLLKCISKNSTKYDGEYVGITYIPKQCLQFFVNQTEKLSTINRMTSPVGAEQVLQKLVKLGKEIKVCDIGNCEWVNVNTTKDLVKAENLIKGQPKHV